MTIRNPLGLFFFFLGYQAVTQGKNKLPHGQYTSDPQYFYSDTDNFAISPYHDHCLSLQFWGVQWQALVRAFLATVFARRFAPRPCLLLKFGHMIDVGYIYPQLNCYCRVDSLLRALERIQIIKTNHLLSRKSLRYWRYWSFLARLRGWLFSFYNHRLRKVVQGVFVMLHFGDKYEHLNKLCIMCPNFSTRQGLGAKHLGKNWCLTTFRLWLPETQVLCCSTVIYK